MAIADAAGVGCDAGIAAVAIDHNVDRNVVRIQEQYFVAVIG